MPDFIRRKECFWLEGGPIMFLWFPLQPALARKSWSLLQGKIHRLGVGFPGELTVIQFCVKALLCQELGMFCSTICPSFTTKMVSAP